MFFGRLSGDPKVQHCGPQITLRLLEALGKSGYVNPITVGSTDEKEIAGRRAVTGLLLV